MNWVDFCDLWVPLRAAWMKTFSRRVVICVRRSLRSDTSVKQDYFKFKMSHTRAVVCSPLSLFWLIIFQWYMEWKVHYSPTLNCRHLRTRFITLSSVHERIFAPFNTIEWTIFMKIHFPNFPLAPHVITKSHQLLSANLQRATREKTRRLSKILFLLDRCQELDGKLTEKK